LKTLHVALQKFKLTEKWLIRPSGAQMKNRHEIKLRAKLPPRTHHSVFLQK